MNRLESMLVFTRVATLGSFTRAAAELGLSPGTVSLHVKELEQELGVRLLSRTTRRSSLTDEGRLYLEHCLRVADEISYIEELLGNTAEVRGTLRVDVPQVFARLVLVPQLARLQAQYPSLVLHVTMENRDLDVAGRELDCAVRIGDLPDSSVVARRLGRMRWITCAAPAYLAAHREPQHPRELAAHDCLGWLQPHTRKLANWQFDVDGQALAITPQGKLAFTSLDPLIEAACEGLGVVQAPDFALRALCAQGRLRPVLGGFEAAGPPVSLIYPHRTHLPAKVRAFGDFLAAILAA